MSFEIEPLPPKRKAEELLKDDHTLVEIKNRLSKTFQPLHMYLFGSRAYGTPRNESDYDILLVVEKTEHSRWDNMSKARDVLSDLDTPAEVFVYSIDEFNDWKHELNTIAEAAYNLGVEIPLGE
jgi:predicted nucleotidyltransferase